MFMVERVFIEFCVEVDKGGDVNGDGIFQKKIIKSIPWKKNREKISEFHYIIHPHSGKKEETNQ